MSLRTIVFEPPYCRRFRYAKPEETLGVVFDGNRPVSVNQRVFFSDVVFRSHFGNEDQLTVLKTVEAALAQGCEIRLVRQ
jgi:hypothetical protein